ncbi:MAG: ATP-binding cassette domain-containing protein, partial [Proteobacteria bacterium]|nr:ATP-binding cassette domain-containing protein [Pseudomonadota bacterium]
MTNQIQTVLDVNQLGKSYKTFKKAPGLMGAIKGFVNRVEIPIHAVQPTSFTIRRGEFIGLLGPNGAGKTTILKMLTGLIPPTSGSAVAFGKYDTSARDKSYLRRIGMVMGQRNQLHADLPAMDSFHLTQAIYDIEQNRFRERLKTCLDLFDIHEKVSVPVRKLSLGERMKMEMINAILHEPELLFLDEPTIGLDFNAAKQIRNFLADANKKLGLTIVLTSHYTKDIEELCRRVIVINHGSMIYDGPLEGLDVRLHGERVFSLTFENSLALNHFKARLTEDSDINILNSTVESSLDLQFASPTRSVGRILKGLNEKINSSDIVDI